MAALEVAGEDAGGEAEFRRIGAGNGFFLGFEVEHAHHGAENLLARDRHVIDDIGENGRFDEEPVGEAVDGRPIAAAHQPRPFFDALVDIGHHLVELRCRDQRTGVDALVHRIAHSRVCRALGEPGEEGLLDALLHEDAVPLEQICPLE